MLPCSVQCLPAITCAEALQQLITQEHTRCCDGFTTRPLDDSYFVIYYNYWDVLEPPGCPVGTLLMQTKPLRPCMCEWCIVEAYMQNWWRIV